MSAAGTGAKRYPKGEAKRQEILSAALTVLERDGEAGASMRVIAKEANISLAGLMHYFPTRDVILTEIQRGADATFEERYRNSETELDPGEVLAQAMLDKANKPGSGTVYLSLAAAAAVDPEHPAGAYLRDRTRGCVRALPRTCVDARSTALFRRTSTPILPPRP